MDTRELILARLAEVLRTTPGVVTFLRNDLIADENRLPAIMLMDGDETVDDGESGSRTPARAPASIIMAPEIYIVLSDTPGEIGESLNVFAARILWRIFNDSELKALARDGKIEYEGMQTGLALGRSMSAEAGIMLNIWRVFAPWRDPEPPTE